MEHGLTWYIGIELLLCWSPCSVYTRSVANAYFLPLRGDDGVGDGGRSWPSGSWRRKALASIVGAGIAVVVVVAEVIVDPSTLRVESIALFFFFLKYVKAGRGLFFFFSFFVLFSFIFFFSFFLFFFFFFFLFYSFLLFCPCFCEWMSSTGSRSADESARRCVVARAYRMETKHSLNINIITN